MPGTGARFSRSALLGFHGRGVAGLVRGAVVGLPSRRLHVALLAGHRSRLGRGLCVQTHLPVNLLCVVDVVAREVREDHQVAIDSSIARYLDSITGRILKRIHFDSTLVDIK